MALKRKSRSFKIFGSYTQKPGTIPGTLELSDNQRDEQVSITVHEYDKDHADSVPVEEIEECASYLNKSSKTWIQVQGLGEIEKVRSICSYFDLHPLIQEDIINTVQRPKAEEYKRCVFIVMRMLRYSPEQQSVETEQVSIIIGLNYILSFQETDQPVFKPIIERIRNGKGRIREAGRDYLAYALIDTITDQYFMHLNDLNVQLEQIEDELIEKPNNYTLQKIHTVRKDLSFTRRSLWPTRDMLYMLTRTETKLIEDSTKIYLRDVHDHMVQILDNLESFRDMSIRMYDMYMSDVSNKMNEVMKVLTIIATIFIPLTFIAGVYGMNFNPEKSPFNMPELNWYWGYIGCLAVMLAIAIIMIIYFRRKEWL
jgi:magnesium transporter